MSSTNAALAQTTPARASVDTLREVVEALAPLEREAGSEGEREAAEWLAARFENAGAPARIDEEEFLDGYADQLARLSAAGAAAGLAGLTRRARGLGALGGAVTAALVVDEASNGMRPVRRATAERKTTWNVVAETGDPDAERTVVVLAHHDAAHGGLIFDQTAQRKLVDLFPGVIERIDTAVPVWWAVAAGPALAAAGAATRRRGLAAAGAALSAFSAVAFKDIARHPVVPGANDNLSGVAALVALAEAFRDRPVAGLRVVLASCGAEEVLQGGIYGFARRHLKGLDRERTWVINLDTIGSPSLAMLEGEGAFVMEDYFDRGLRDLSERVAVREGIAIRRGMRASTSTDSVIPSRMGIPTVCFTSLNRHKALSNYHSLTDTPENLVYPTIACATDLTEAVARELAAPASA
jgi:acetylornithine deacetylase/succinyl-diaminopimelate desuccinylase-like protein